MGPGVSPPPSTTDTPLGHVRLINDSALCNYVGHPGVYTGWCVVSVTAQWTQAKRFFVFLRGVHNLLVCEWCLLVY